MIRWYDYVIVFAAADLMWANIKLALVAPTMLAGILGSIGAYAIWYLWHDLYIPFRKDQELNKDE